MGKDVRGLKVAEEQFPFQAHESSSGFQMLSGSPQNSAEVETVGMGIVRTETKRLSEPNQNSGTFQC